MSVTVSVSVSEGSGGGDGLRDAYLDGGEPAEGGVAGRSAGASGSAPAPGGVAGGQSRRMIWSRKDPGSIIEWFRCWCTSTVSWQQLSQPALLQARGVECKPVSRSRVRASE